MKMMMVICDKIKKKTKNYYCNITIYTKVYRHTYVVIDIRFFSVLLQVRYVFMNCLFYVKKCYRSTKGYFLHLSDAGGKKKQHYRII